MNTDNTLKIYRVVLVIPTGITFITAVQKQVHCKSMFLLPLDAHLKCKRFEISVVSFKIPKGPVSRFKEMCLSLSCFTWQ